MGMEKAGYIICKVLYIKDLKSASLVYVLKRPSIAMNGERKQIMIYIYMAELTGDRCRGLKEEGGRKKGKGVEETFALGLPGWSRSSLCEGWKGQSVFRQQGQLGPR